MVDYRETHSRKWFGSILFVLLLLFSFPSLAQGLQRVAVYNIADGESVISAVVLNGDRQLAVTDENGRFTAIYAAERRVYTLKYFGTDIELVLPATLKYQANVKVGVNLSLSINEVTVSTQNVAGTSQATYRIEKLTQPPVLLGQPDILRSLALRSGIAHGQEGNANIFVRGGTPEQNLMLIDDAPIYNVNHLAGFLSVFNDDAIRAVTVYKTSPPLAYGNRLSSVIDVRLNNGPTEQWRGKAGIGIVSANVYVEGPIIRNKTSLILGVRAGYWDLINLGVDKKAETDFFDLRMSDITAKITHRFSDRHQLSLSSYRSNDINAVAENTSTFSDGGQNARRFSKLTTRYGNQTVSLRDFHELSPRASLTTFAYFTNYRNEYDEIRRQYRTELIIEEEEEVKSRLKNFGGTTQLRLAGHRAEYTFGLNFSRTVVDPLNASINRSAPADNPLQSDATTLTVFGGGDFRITERMQFRGGFRANLYRNGPYQKFYPELRARFNYRFSSTSRLTLSANLAGQELQILSSGTLGQNSDAYVLANTALPLQTGWQTDVGYHREFSKAISLKLGYYFRRMENVLFYQNFGQGIEEAAAVLRDVRTGGNGFSHGLEMETAFNWRKFEVLLTCTMARTKHRFPSLNEGQYFPFRYDRPLDLALNLNYAIGSKYRLGANFIFQSGIAVTTPTARVPASEHFTSYNVVRSINNARFPAYHRLDLSISRIWRGKRDNQNTLRFSIYNLYNRVNATFYSSRAFTTGQGGITVQSLRVGQFGFFPSLFYSRTFGNHEK